MERREVPEFNPGLIDVLDSSPVRPWERASAPDRTAESVPEVPSHSLLAQGGKNRARFKSGHFDLSISETNNQ